MLLNSDQEALAQARFARWSKRVWLVENFGGPDALLAMIRKDIEIDPEGLGATTEADQDHWRPGLHAKLIHSEPGMFGEIVVIEDSYKFRSMRFGVNGPRQSLIDLDHPHALLLRYAKVAMLGLLWVPRPKAVLIVGLGAGNIPSFFRHHFPETAIDVVEIDPAVLAVAGNFFNFHKGDSLVVHLMDGRQFIDKQQSPYNMIIVDAHGTEGPQKHLATLEALQAFGACLMPGGIMISNTWGADMNEDFLCVIDTYRSVFSACYVAAVKNSVNRLIFAANDPKQAVNFVDLKRRAREVDEQLMLPFRLEDELSDENDALNKKLQHEAPRSARVWRDSVFSQSAPPPGS